MGSNACCDETRSSGDLITSIRETAKNCFDFIELKKIAFNEIKLPKRKYMATKRSFYVKQINSQLEMSVQMDNKESATQWIRRRSSELLGLRSNGTRIDYRIVISSDRSKVAVFAKNNRFINEMSILYAQNEANNCKTQLFLKNAFIIGITNDAKRVIYSHYSTKNASKMKNGIKIDLIAISFDICDGFYLEDSDSAIIISTSGLVCRHRLGRKQTDSSIMFNNKLSKIVSADLNADYGLVWLDTLSHNNNTHKFIAFDTNSLDIYTTIETDCFSIHKFSINACNDRSVIIVKSDPINGKLKKAIDILMSDSHKERFFDSHEEIFDMKCFSFDDETHIQTIGDTNENTIETSINSTKQSEENSLIILVTKDSANILIEYKYNNLWNKSTISFDKVKDISEINAIKVVKIIKTKSDFNVTLIVYCCESYLIDFKVIFKT